MPTQPPPIALSEIDCPLVSAQSLIENYDVLLLDAFGVLVERYMRASYAVAFSVTRRHEDAQDVAHCRAIPPRAIPCGGPRGCSPRAPTSTSTIRRCPITAG